MEQGIIDEVVSQKALDQVKKLTAELNAALAVLEKLIAAQLQVGAGGGGGNSKPKQLDELAKAQAKVLALETQLSTAQAKYDTELGKQVKLINESKVAISELTKVKKLEAMINKELSDSYAGMKAQYDLNIIRINKLSTDTAKLSAADKLLISDTEKLSQALIKQQQAGHNQAKGMNNAYNSTFQLTQVMRELPNFAIDARIGFMSLSNNLPMLADGFKQLSNSIDATTGKALGNMGAFKVFAKSLLSLNTIMIVAVTLMTLFGDKIVDWIGGLFKGSKAVDEFVTSSKQMAQAMRDGASESQNERTKLDLLYKATQDTNKSMGQRIKATKELQRIYPEYFGNLSTESILEGKGKKTKDELTASILQQSRARAALNLMVKNDEEILRLEPAIEWRKRYIEQLVAERKGLSMSIEDRQKYATSLNEETKAYKEIALMEKGLKNAQGANVALYGSIKDIGDVIDPPKITKGGKAMEVVAEKTKIYLDVLKAVEAQLSTDTTSIFGKSASPETTYETHKKTLDGLTQALKDANQEYTDELYKQFEIDETIKDMRYDLYRESVQTTMDLVNGITDYYINKLEEQSDALTKSEEYKLQEVEDANKQGLLSDEDYQAQKQSIQAQFDAKQEEIDKKKAEADKAAFLAGQAAALANVWINYFQSVGSFANMIAGGAFTPLYAALAAVSTAGIIAQSIPAFAEGGIMGENGLALVGDGGKSELAITPSGQVYKTPSTPTLTYLEAGTVIKPDASILNNQEINKALMINAGNNVDFSDLRKDLHVLTDEVKKLKAEPSKSANLMDMMKFNKDYN